MKHLLLFFLFSGSLDSFSQVADSTWELRNNNDGTLIYGPPERTDLKPDTLRAIMLVTLSHMYHGIAHARMGFVIVQPGRKTIYLDCRKRPLKYPAMGWRYEVVDKNF